MNGGDFADLLRGEAIILDLAAPGKAQMLAMLAEHAAPIAGIAPTMILERVLEREALGSTGFGQGAAIPHARLAGPDRVTLVVARLATPIAYGALDGEPVDLVVLLLSPEGAGADHLKALARISRALRNPRILAAMRSVETPAAMLNAIDASPMNDARAA